MVRIDHPHLNTKRDDVPALEVRDQVRLRLTSIFSRRRDTLPRDASHVSLLQSDKNWDQSL
jgi:hypothetical protein